MPLEEAEPWAIDLIKASIANDREGAMKVLDEKAEKFYLRDYDRRGYPAEGVAYSPVLLQDVTFLDPHAGERVWIYLALLPVDETDPGEVDLARGGSRTCWAASNVYPGGELGTMPYPAPPDQYAEITKEVFMEAAKKGWPGITGGQG